MAKSWAKFESKIKFIPSPANLAKQVVISFARKKLKLEITFELAHSPYSYYSRQEAF